MTPLEITPDGKPVIGVTTAQTAADVVLVPDGSPPAEPCTEAAPCEACRGRAAGVDEKRRTELRDQLLADLKKDDGWAGKSLVNTAALREYLGRTGGPGDGR